LVEQINSRAKKARRKEGKQRRNQKAGRQEK
jgi:hypothetical protein